MRFFRNKVLLVGIVCLAPAVFGWLAYVFHWAPGTTDNYGELLAPQALSGPPLDAARGKWTLVAFDAAACDAHCEKKLYFMRQIRRAQGKEMERVARLWVLTDAGAPRTEVLAAIEGTLVARAGDAFSRRFPGNPTDHIYLIDPLGNLMMRYPRDPQPKGMIKDLQRLLKYSRIG
jgi:hypothetical protein